MGKGKPGRKWRKSSRPVRNGQRFWEWRACVRACGPTVGQDEQERQPRLVKGWEVSTLSAERTPMVGEGWGAQTDHMKSS